MGAVRYTARRSVLPPHVAARTYGLEADVVECSRQRTVDKETHRSLSGRTETLHFYSDSRWQLRFAPVRGIERLQLLEFLDSTADGQPFQCWLHEDEAVPLQLQRDDQGYREEPFMPLGSLHLDWVQISITAREIA